MTRRQPTYTRMAVPPDFDSGERICLEHGLIPLLVWRRVPITREVRRGITPVERFLLEAALKLSPFRPMEISWITAIPDRAVHHISRRLASMGLLDPGPGSSFAACPDRIEAALDSETLVSTREDVLTFVFLPWHGDLIAVDERAGQKAPRFNRRWVYSQAPVPSELAGMAVMDFLENRVTQQWVSALPEDILHIRKPEQDAGKVWTIPPMCPAYRCKGSVAALDAGFCARLRFLHPNAGGDGRKTPSAIDFHLDAASGLIDCLDKLKTTCEQTAEHRRIWNSLFSELALSSSMAQVDKISFSIDRQTAEHIAAKGYFLVQPIGVQATHEELTIGLRIELKPEGPDAAELFFKDEAIGRMLRLESQVDWGGVAESAAGAARAYGLETPVALSPGELVARCWQLGHYSLVYALREKGDFPHDQ